MSIEIEVRVRTDQAAQGRALFSVPWGTDLEETIALLRRWGVETDYGSLQDFSGQFVVRDGSPPFFEIVGDTGTAE